MIAPDSGKVGERAEQAREALMVLGANLPLARRLVAGRADLVGFQTLQKGQSSIEDAQMRGEKFVRGTYEEVAPERLHIDGTVWAVVDSINEGVGADLVRPAHHLGHIIDSATRIGGVAYRDDLRTLRDLGAHVGHIERTGDGVNSGEAHHSTAILSHGQPGRDVRIMVEGRYHNLIPRPHVAAECPAKSEGERRHVWAENDFTGIRGIEEVRHRNVYVCQEYVGALAGQERAFNVRIRGR